MKVLSVGLMRLKDVLQIHGPDDNPITVRQLGDDPDYRPLLKEIQTSGESNIVLDCDPDKILDILRQAREVKLMEDYQVVTINFTATLSFSPFNPLAKEKRYRYLHVLNTNLKIG